MLFLRRGREEYRTMTYFVRVSFCLPATCELRGCFSGVRHCRTRGRRINAWGVCLGVSAALMRVRRPSTSGISGPENEVMSLGGPQILSHVSTLFYYTRAKTIICQWTNLDYSNMESEFELWLISNTNETSQDLSHWQSRKICANFLSLTRQCGPLENAARAKFGPRPWFADRWSTSNVITITTCHVGHRIRCMLVRHAAAAGQCSALM